ncbi:DUF6090 family protein [Balneola sp. MJW-20]|uniref:DUF6090 family protein n=1 Tax=Gracilimonas aurantiaca TaxID=3234185 RepID=UPI0034672088
MITLFRRIRQKLIDSGSLTRYLLYAIGEILLVVIGILIALQVNNWNEVRKTENRRIQLLENIRSDYLSNELRLNEAYLDSYHINTNTQRFMELLSYEPETATYDSLLKYGTGFIGVTTFSPVNSSYLTAQSTGDIGLIEDKELLESFIEYQKALDWLNFHVELSGNMVYLGNIQKMREQLGSLYVIFNAEDPDPFPATFNMSENEFRSFFQLPKSYAAVESMYWINRNVLRSINNMQNINENILDKIDELLEESQ